MGLLTDNELDTIRSKVTRNTAVKSTTLMNKIGQELFDSCVSKNLIEVKAGKAKFSSSFWNELKPKKTKSSSKSSASKTTYKIADAQKDIMDLKEDIKKINEQLSVFTGLFAQLQGSSSTKSSTNRVSSDIFKQELKTAYETINTNERRGGMVPIPKLWDILNQKGINRSQFEEELFKLEKDRVIELQIASDPKLVSEKEKSIHHPSRGLINYVVWRR